MFPSLLDSFVGLSPLATGKVSQLQGSAEVGEADDRDVVLGLKNREIRRFLWDLLGVSKHPALVSD